MTNSPLVKSHPHPQPLCNAISICSTLKSILKCLAASSLIWRRSCLHCSSPIPLPTISSTTHWRRNLVIHKILSVRLIALVGERRAIGLIVYEVYMDSSSPVYSLACGPFSGSPAAPSGSSSSVVHVWDADASTDPPWRVKEKNLRGCLFGVGLVFSLTSLGD